MSKTHAVCCCCGKTFPRSQVMPFEAITLQTSELIAKEITDWKPGAFVCYSDLHRFRNLYLRNLLTAEREDMSQLHEEVLESLAKEESLVAKIAMQNAERPSSLGERVADKVASFGGSWGFICSFAAFLVIWLVLNSAVILFRPFDPFPYILLNLILSCLAAVQAPIIMMSQNRVESRDRQRAMNDYRINLKSEMEIRLLSRRIDHLLNQQWERLLEIQELQVELMERKEK